MIFIATNSISSSGTSCMSSYFFISFSCVTAYTSFLIWGYGCSYLLFCVSSTRQILCGTGIGLFGSEPGFIFDMGAKDFLTLCFVFQVPGKFCAVLVLFGSEP